jgi:hypothetical protein
MLKKCLFKKFSFKKGGGKKVESIPFMALPFIFLPTGLIIGIFASKKDLSTLKNFFRFFLIVPFMRCFLC